jgi:hypothetical protein
MGRSTASFVSMPNAMWTCSISGSPATYEIEA